ncbi:hypothetical protein ACFL0C_01155 [Patescibacteria group bacterium]
MTAKFVCIVPTSTVPKIPVPIDGVFFFYGGRPSKVNQCIRGANLWIHEDPATKDPRKGGQLYATNIDLVLDGHNGFEVVTPSGYVPGDIVESIKRRARSIFNVYRIG